MGAQKREIHFRAGTGHKGLVACRAFFSANSVNRYFNIIPPCIAYRQAAGTAAAMDAKAGTQPRSVDYRELQANLIRQGVNLSKQGKPI